MEILNRCSDVQPLRAPVDSRALCFICFHHTISKYSSDTFLEMQGIPSTDDEKVNVLQVLCQLLRVPWTHFKNMFSTNVSLPFCLACLKSAVDIIVLREQLFALESSIRSKIESIERSVAQNCKIKNGFCSKFDEDFENVDQTASSYESCRDIFQQHVFNEHSNKQLMQKKVEEFKKFQPGTVELTPSLVQLKLQKNVFEILKTEPKQGNCLRDGSDKAEKRQVKRSRDGSDKAVKVKVEVEPVCSTAEFDQSESEVFTLGLVQPEAKNIPVYDISDSDAEMPLLQPEKPTEVSKVLKMPRPQLQQPITEEKETNDDSYYYPSCKKLKRRKRAVTKKKPIIQESTKSESDGSADGSDSDFVLDGSGPESSETGSDDERALLSSRKKRLPDPTKLLTINHVANNKRKNREKYATVVSATVNVDQGNVKFRGKDGTEWSGRPTHGAKTRDYERVRPDGGLVGPAADPTLSPTDLFKLMITPDIVDTIVRYSNQFADSLGPPTCKSEANAPPPKPVSRDEIYAYIGILLYMGVERKRRTREVWNKDPKYMIPPIIATMGRNRFDRISKCLRFDDRSKRDEQAAGPSRLGYISEVFDPFVSNIQSHLNPYDFLVVDEMLVKFKGKVKFRVYMKSKPGQNGIKIWALCDATTGYVLRLCIYEGKVGDTVETQLGKKVVLGLVENYFGSGRTVTTDNFFTSKALGTELLLRNMTLLGTLNKNRMDMIPEFADGRGKELASSLFAFHKKFTMVSYVPRNNKTVVLLSTEHHSATVDPTIKNKPQMILDYNATKSAIDVADLMVAHFSCQRQTQRWPVKVFQAMCDIAALNAYIIWRFHHGEKRGKGLHATRRDFLRDMAEGLMRPAIRERASEEGAHGHMRFVVHAMDVMGYSPSLPIDDNIHYANGKRSMGNCGECGKTSRTHCMRCNKYVCVPHRFTYIFCKECNHGHLNGLKQKLGKSTKVCRPEFICGIKSVADLGGGATSSDDKD